MPNDAAVLPREHLIRALEADLVGPFQPDADGGVAEEILPIPPSGFLAPQEGRDPQDSAAEESLGAGLDDESEESASQDPEPKQNLLPACDGRHRARYGRADLLSLGGCPPTRWACVRNAERRLDIA